MKSDQLPSKKPSLRNSHSSLVQVFSTGIGTAGSGGDIHTPRDCQGYAKPWGYWSRV
jgi:hypothetical protein